MHSFVAKLTNQHERIIESLDDSLLPFVQIRDKNLPAPPNPEEIARPLLQWMQREFLPHLVEEEELFRAQCAPTQEGQALFDAVISEHDKLRKLLLQAREEVSLLLGEVSIREAWWDTVDLSTMWTFRKALSKHMDFEYHEVLPKAIALSLGAGD